MAQKKGQRSTSEDPDELARVPLQALLLADSFAQKFRPITLERPKVLLPLVNVPMIEYTLTWLESVGVEEVFVFCCAHAKQVKDYLAKSQWTSQGPAFTVKPVESHDATSAGDALRTIFNLGLIRGDFVLISGDTVSNMSLTQALQEHKERRKNDPLAIMTMVIKKSKFSSLTNQSRLGNDEILMAIHPETKELLYYEDKADHSQQFTSLDKMLLCDNPTLHLFNDKQDCYVDICSPEVLSLFADNFDYQYLRRHFVKGLLVDDIMGYRIFTHEIHSSYAARVDNFRSYDTISKDILQRWTYPLVPDVLYFGCSQMKLDRRGIYQAPDVIRSRSANVDAFSLIGSGTAIGDNSVITNSVIGQGCTIGCNVSIKGCYIWDNVIIDDNCKLSHALCCDGVHLRAGVVLEPGIVLSFKVEVGQQSIVPGYSKVSLLPQPSKQDSDEELEYVDANNAILGSPSISSMLTARNLDFTSDSDMENLVPSEVAFSGTGFLWSMCEGGHEEEWRHSIAPMPLKKLMDSVNSHADPVIPDSDEGAILASRELALDSDSTVSDDGAVEDYRDSNDFEKEVEATFQRALEGVNEDNVILEINSLRLSYNMSQTDCAGALFYSILKSALAEPHYSNKELCKNTEVAIIKWKNLLKHYLISVDEEIEVIQKFEDMSLESAEEFSPLFSTILHCLYDKDILSEDAILSWAQEKEEADESDKIFVKQSEKFITWLKEAPEEDDEDVD